MSSPFEALGLSAALVRAVAELGYAEPTAIQAAAIPAALAGRDVIGCAHTGSGKTAAFGLVLLHRLDAAVHAARHGIWSIRSVPNDVRTYALVLVPTRELAAQVGETIRDLARHLDHAVKVAVVFGGVSVNPQMLAMRGGADVIIATPGRLLDLHERHAVTLDHVDLLVLDEADRLLDEGFADELARVTALLPAGRQNLFFSATFPPAVQALQQALLCDPVRVDVSAAPGAGVATPAYPPSSSARWRWTRRSARRC